MNKRQRTWKSPVAVFLFVFCTVLVASTFARRAMARSSKPADAPVVVSNWAEIARVGHAAGSATPVVTVIVFADYECVGCAAFHPMLQTAQRLMGDDLRVVTRHFPLSIHKHASAAANAAECAGEQGRFSQIEDVLYADQDSIGKRSWSSFADRAGVRDTATFNVCVKKEQFRATVDRDRTAAKALDLKGTPSYIVNGELHFGTPTQAVLLQQLRDAASVARANKMNDSATQATRATSAVPLRQWRKPLTLERTIAGESSDELLMPSGIATTSAGELVVFDYGAMEVRAFARSGQPLWREGRKGAGPGEFRNVMDLKVRANGEIALLDMANRRITALSSTGRVKRTVPIKVSASRFVSLADTNTYTLAGDDSSTLWNSVSLGGITGRRMPVPGSLASHHGLSREQFTAPFGAGAVMVYRWSDKILVLAADGAVHSIINGIESVAMPGVKQYATKFGKFSGSVARIDPNATQAALSVATNGHQIFVLFAGATEQRSRIIDVYDAASERYAGSYLLPAASQELAVLPDGAIAALRLEPVPAIDIWQGATPPKQNAVGTKVSAAAKVVK